MKCDKFEKLFNQESQDEPSSEMKQHAASCPPCGALLSLQHDIETSLVLLGSATPTVDLSAGIMSKVRNLAPTQPAQPTLWETIGQFFQGQFLKPALALGLAGLLVAGISLHQLKTPTTLNPTGWHVVSEVAGLAPDDKAESFADGEWVQAATGKPMRLASAAGATAILTEGRAQVLSDGLTLESGRVDLTVPKQPAGTTFAVRTKLGIVRVIGTAFSVELTDRKLRVAVTEGVVAVESARETRTLRAGDSHSIEETVSAETEPGRPVLNQGTANATQEAETPGN